MRVHVTAELWRNGQTSPVFTGARVRGVRCRRRRTVLCIKVAVTFKVGHRFKRRCKGGHRRSGRQGFLYRIPISGKETPRQRSNAHWSNCRCSAHKTHWISRLGAKVAYETGLVGHPRRNGIVPTKIAAARARARTAGSWANADIFALHAAKIVAAVAAVRVATVRVTERPEAHQAAVTHSQGLPVPLRSLKALGRVRKFASCYIRHCVSSSWDSLRALSYPRLHWHKRHEHPSSYHRFLPCRALSSYLLKSRAS